MADYPMPQAGGNSPTNAAAPNAFATSSGALNEGVDTLSRVANPFAVNMTMNQFMNPYRASVIDNAVGRLEDARSRELNDIEGQAFGAKAFGGSRHGVVDAYTRDNYSRNRDELVSRLLQEGFDTTANLSLGALGQQESAGRGLVDASGSAFNLGQGALNMQQQAGGQIQNLVQNLLAQASGQTDAFINYPQTSLGTALAGVQGNPLAAQTTTTQSYNPGLFDYLSFGAGLVGSGMQKGGLFGGGK